MKIYYDTQEDQLRITLTEGQSFESEEVAEGMVFDYDKAGNVVAMEIEHAMVRLHLPAVARRDLVRALEAATGNLSGFSRIITQGVIFPRTDQPK